MRAIIITLFLFSFAISQNMEDVVYLKNGSIIRGIIVEQIFNKSIKLQTRDGNIFVYEISEIEKVTKENIKRTNYQNDYDENKVMRFHLALNAGNGFEDGYNFGIGATMSVITSSNIVFGINFTKYLGKSFTDYYYAANGYPLVYGAKLTSYYIFADIGYYGEVNKYLVIKPYLSLGYFDTQVKYSGNVKGENSEGRFSVAPNLTIQLVMNENITFGIDNKYAVITGENGSSANAYCLMGQIGIIF